MSLMRYHKGWRCYIGPGCHYCLNYMLKLPNDFFVYMSSNSIYFGSTPHPQDASHQQYYYIFRRPNTKLTFFCHDCIMGGGEGNIDPKYPKNPSTPPVRIGF